TYQGIILRDSSLPLWGSYLAKLFENNETKGVAKFLSLYNVKYVILNPPEDIYWIYSSKSYFYYYSVLNKTSGFRLVDIGTKGAKVFLNEFTLSPVRVVKKAGLLVGSMSDMIKVIDTSDINEWVFQFIDSSPSSTINLDMYSAIIYGRNRGIVDILVHMVNECYRIPLWDYASLWNTKESSKWVLGYPLASNLVQEVIISPKGLLANPFPDQIAQMSLEFYAPQSTLYDIWLRAGAGSLGGSITVIVSNEEVGSVTISPDSDAGLKWIKVGSIQLEKGLTQIKILGTGQVFLDVMIVVPKYIFEKLETSVSRIIESKSYTLDEFISIVALDNRFEKESFDVQWIRKSPTSLYIKCVNTSNTFLVFSELYDPLWMLKSKFHEGNSIVAYGLVNMFIMNSPILEGEIEYIPQRFVDLGVYISIFGFLLVIILIFLSSRLQRIKFLM
ncbi:MAG: hypothetical protein ACP5IZ_11625, partial [Thermoprotei archaeon]